jgi:hypothetical protein
MNIFKTTQSVFQTPELAASIIQRIGVGSHLSNSYLQRFDLSQK